MTITPALSVYSAYGIPAATDVAQQLAATATLDATGLTGSSAVVELSGLGQLLSATSLFQNSLAVLQPGSASSGLGTNFGTDFGSLAAEVHNFVDTFNTLQSTLASLQSPVGALAGNTLANQFVQALNTQVTATFANGETGPTTLGQLGVELQPVAGGGASALTVNLQSLQSAFAANPTGTFSLLAQAVQSFGNLAANFAAQAGAESSTVGALGLGGGGFGGFSLADLFALESLGGLGGSNSFGFADLLALSALGGGGALTLTQQLTALNEFNLVSSLIG